MKERLSRRKAIVGTGGLIAAGGAGVMLTGSAAAAESDLTIEGTQIITHDGEVDDVTVTASLDASYEGCANVDTLVFRLQTIKGGNAQTLAEETVEADDPHTGSASVDFTDVSVIDNSGWAAWEFDASEDGGEATTTVPIRAFFAAAAGTNSEATDRATTNADVTVKNIEASADVSGEGSLDAEADSEVEN